MKTLSSQLSIASILLAGCSQGFDISDNVKSVETKILRAYAAGGPTNCKTVELFKESNRKLKGTVICSQTTHECIAELDSDLKNLQVTCEMMGNRVRLN
jgi:hypothetical protein